MKTIELFKGEIFMKKFIVLAIVVYVLAFLAGSYSNKIDEAVMNSDDVIYHQVFYYDENGEQQYQYLVEVLDD